MTDKTARIARWAKWVLFLLALAWAVYASYYIWLAYQVFTWLDHLNSSKPRPPVPYSLPDYGDVLETILAAYGPAIAAGILLRVKWPEKRGPS